MLRQSFIRFSNISLELGGYTEMAIVRLVLDVLKSIRGPSIIDLAEKLAELEGVSTVSVKVNEVDVETLTLTVIVEGNDITFEDVRSVIEDMGGVIHSIDEVIAKS